MHRIGWFSTGRGPGSRALLTAIQEAIIEGELKAQISFVFSNREQGEAEGSDLFFELVQKYHLPLVQLSSRKFLTPAGRYLSPDWRLGYDREVMKRISDYPADIIVLAGYMLIVGPELCRKHSMINLHPALPGGPTGAWQEVIWKLFESDAGETGAMMHLVTPEMDRGPVATYFRFPIRGGAFDRYWAEISKRPLAEIKASEGENNPLFKLIRNEGAKRELPLILETLKALSSGAVRIENGQVLDSGGRPVSGLDLTAEVERAIAAGPVD